jgi:hypothetical protein
MAGTIVADTIQADSTSTLVLKNGVANTPPTIQDSAGTQIGTFCRAFVNFNGTGTVAIRASFNVSSITDNNTGDYTVNFTTAMSDANYSVNALVDNTGAASGGVLVAASQTGSFATSSIRILSRNAGAPASPSDSASVCVAVFR